MNVTDSILKTIEYAIDKKLKPYTNMDVSGIIVRIPEDDNDAYKVQIDDVEYKVANGSGIGFQVGDPVWIHCPNGDFNKKFIVSSKSSNSKKSVVNSSSTQGGGSYAITKKDIITNEEIDAMFQ